ncbi:MAG: hypothetical protein JXR46_01510 [Calditrichaceae bacterium]|nr:hypothetical protein [Calditrichaceae bacterium]MBN2707695.1 hypothetical protein [Calditrichaceae bacterium]RQV96491.1 MAG: hypothetical protein EH224_04540 [Calditrichota bacterium]
MNNQKKALGLILIFLGIVFLLENLSIIEFDFLRVWPLFVILSGLGFWLGYLVNRQLITFIMPGTLLLIYGFLFFYCGIFGWDMMSYLWPVFLLGPGVGFFLIYLLGDKNKILLWPAGLLTVISFLFIFRYLEYLRYWPSLLIIGGIILIFMKDRKVNTEG